MNMVHAENSESRDAGAVFWHLVSALHPTQGNEQRIQVCTINLGKNMRRVESMFIYLAKTLMQKVSDQW